jgi:hypothetical protein
MTPLSLLQMHQVATMWFASADQGWRDVKSLASSSLRGDLYGMEPRLREGNFQPLCSRSLLPYKMIGQFLV